MTKPRSACPFCGGEPRLTQHRWAGNGRHKGYQVSCAVCKAACAIRVKLADAVALWENRVWQRSGVQG